MRKHTVLLLATLALLVACALPPRPAPPEATRVTEPSPGPVQTEMPRITSDPELVVDVYDPDKVWDGTTLLTDKHTGQARLIEVDMLGEIVWEYKLPDEWSEGIVGFEVELLPNGNVLFTVTRSGIYEVDRDGNIVWSHRDPKVSHDADRLENGNTLYVFGANDQKTE